MDEIDAIFEKSDEEIINEATSAGMDIDGEVEKTKAIFEKAVSKWGRDSQVKMAIEECSELITKLSHFMRGRVNDIEVGEEIADVEIMLSQLRIMFGDSNVDWWKRKKLERIGYMLRDNTSKE